MLNRLFLLLSIFAIGCSSTQKNSSNELTQGRTNRPQWMSDTQAFCGSEKLCAIGEGTSFLRAETQARTNLAKVFKVSIDSTTTIEESTSSLSTPDSLLSSGVNEEVEMFTRETVDEVLEGVVTSKKHEEEDGSIFALAELDKRVAAKVVRPRLKAIDDEIELAYESNRRSLLPRALELDLHRDGLKTFLAILGVADFSGGITRKELLEKKAQYDAAPIKVLVTDEGQWEAIASTVKGELTTLGYKIVSKGAHDFKLVVSNTARREYLNIKGFERYNVNVNLRSLDSNGNVVGGLAFEEAANGRSLAQIRSNILLNFKTNFYNNFSGLFLD